MRCSSTKDWTAQKPSIWLTAWSFPQNTHTLGLYDHTAKARLHNSDQQKLCKYLKEHMCRQSPTNACCGLPPETLSRTTNQQAHLLQ
jgi:hypothetical protein